MVDEQLRGPDPDPERLYQRLLRKHPELPETRLRAAAAVESRMIRMSGDRNDVRTEADRPK